MNQFIEEYEKKCVTQSLPILLSQFECHYAEPYEIDLSIKQEKNLKVPIGKIRQWFAQAINKINAELTTDYLISPSSLDEELGVQYEMQGQQSMLRTGNLQDLNTAINNAINDRHKVANPPITDDLLLKQIYLEDVEHFYSERVLYHAEEITQIIQAMIEIDAYPKHWFGKFQDIRSKIFTEDDPKIANKMLGMLIRIGRSQLPMDVVTEDKIIIDSNTVKPSNVQGG